MKINNKLLLAAISAVSMTIPIAIKADRIEIEVGDRPYHMHGDRYWDGDYEMTWAPGHWSEHGHHWIHGHYVRGEHRRHHDDHRDGHDDHHDDDHH